MKEIISISLENSFLELVDKEAKRQKLDRTKYITGLIERDIHKPKKIRRALTITDITLLAILITLIFLYVKG
jgi:hypothetical protein